MDLILVALGVVALVHTVNALWPVGRTRPLLSVWSWTASWLLIEFAWVALVVQAALTGVLVGADALEAPAGWAGLALMVASGAGLVAVLVRTAHTSQEIRAAFVELDLPETQPRRLPVARTRDVVYATVDGRPLRLDVHHPRDPDQTGARRPAIVQVHGGAWVAGDKRTQGLPLLKHLASQGWVGFNVNYRLSPRATFPDHLVDLKRAVAWIREHADEHGIDPGFLAVTGGSAGGHLSTLLALTAGDPRFQPGFEDTDTSVQAAVPFYGVYDLGLERGYYPVKTVRRLFARVILKASPTRQPERFRLASAFEHLRPDAPPFFVIHGALDTLAPVQMARDFVAALRRVSNAPVAYLELAGAQHAFEVLPSVRTRLVVRAVERWLGAQWDAHRADRAAAGEEAGADVTGPAQPKPGAGPGRGEPASPEVPPAAKTAGSAGDRPPTADPTTADPTTADPTTGAGTAPP